MRKDFVLLFATLGLYALLVGAACWVCSDEAQAHSGGTDSSGGHYNRKTGQYHYHGKPKNRSGDADAAYDWTPDPPKSSPAKSSLHANNSEGHATVRLTSSNETAVGSFQLESQQDEAGAAVYKLRYTLTKDAQAKNFECEVDEETVIEYLEELCAMLDEIKSRESNE